MAFFPSTLDDNPALIAANPQYRARLMALPRHERLRLLGGNWKAEPTAGEFFQRHWFPMVDAAPAELIMLVRDWDRAATPVSRQNPDPDWTSGCLMGKGRDGLFYVLDYRRARLSPGGVVQLIKQTASEDGPHVEIALEQEPGASGKSEAQHLAKQLAGHRVRIYPKRVDKPTAADPLASQAAVGNVRIVRGPWNKAVLDQFEHFPGGKHDDDVDSASGALGVLTGTMKGQSINAARQRRPTSPSPETASPQRRRCRCRAVGPASSRPRLCR